MPTAPCQAICERSAGPAILENECGYERARLEHEAEVQKLEGEKKKIDFGSQLRSYTLHPSQRVKDHRTGQEAGNAAGVLDGQLDPFIRSYLLFAAEN